MVSPYSTPRLLMNRLRQMTAEGGAVQDRLNKLVKMIAGTMVADVCSIYLRTDDELLELVATEGLRAEAISTTRMGLDEGLVGRIAMTARPLSPLRRATPPRRNFTLPERFGVCDRLQRPGQ